MKSSKLVTAAVVGLLALVAAARPGLAQMIVSCPQLEPSFTITGVSGTGSTQTSADQATLGIGGCATLRFVIVSQPGSVVTDVTSKTTFVTDPTRGTIMGNVFCVGPADCSHQFPVYGIYHDPCSNTNLVDTVHITVAPCPVVAPEAGCPQIETSLFFGSVNGVTTTGHPDQATLSVGQCATLQLQLTRQSGQDIYVGLALDNVHFVSDRGTITGNTICVGPADANHQFTVYAIYFDVCSKTTITATAHLTVRPLPPTPPTPGCPQLEPSFSIAGVTNGTQTSADQATVNVGGCVTLKLLIGAQPGGTTDVTQSANTTFTTNPTQGHLTSKNVWCATAADCNHQFPIYAIYHDPCTGTTLVSTVHVTVTPCGTF